MRCRLGDGGDGFEVAIERLELWPGDMVAITGPSGCGKSTMLALLSLALRPDLAEHFVVGSADVAALWTAGRRRALDRLRAATLGYVPQTGGLLPFLTLRANIALPLALLGRPDPVRVEQLATALDIAGALDRRPAHVSVGQRQRAAVARAVVHAPRLILADEPTAAIHPAQARATLGLLVQAAAGAALLIATHDLALADAAGLRVVAVRTAAAGACGTLTWPC